MSDPGSSNGNSSGSAEALLKELECYRRRVRALEGILAERDLQVAAGRKEETRLAQAFQPAKIRAWFWTADSRQTQYIPNRGDVCDSRGGPASQVSFPDGTLLQNIYPDDRERLASIWDWAYEEHVPYDIEYRIVLTDGEVRHNHEIGSPEFDESGQYVGHFGTTQDITGRKQAEEALKDRQRQFINLTAELQYQTDLLQLALNNTMHGIAMFDLDGQLIVHNARYLSIYGFSADVVGPGVSIEQILDYSIALGNYTGEEAARIKSERVRQIRSLKPSTYEQHLQDGRTVTVNHQPMPDGGSVTTCEDITETLRRERTSAELSRSAALADAANAAKSAFLANMSHELRTPLNAVIGFSQVIHDELLGPLGDPAYRTYAKDIFDSGANLLRIVDHMLEMALLSDGGTSLNAATFDLAELLTETISNFDARAREKDLSIRLSGTEQSTPFVGDRTMLGRALESIVENAVKYSPPDGVVVVSMKITEDDPLSISVSDTGPGIPKDKVADMLTAFGQAESGYTREHQGAGLGLSIADGFVRLHGGTLTIDSTPKLGTTVRINLPQDRLAPLEQTLDLRLRKQAR